MQLAIMTVLGEALEWGAGVGLCVAAVLFFVLGCVKLAHEVEQNSKRENPAGPSDDVQRAA